MSSKQTDVLLVGAGPIGIELAAALKKNQFDYVHVEAGNLASTIEWYAPGTSIFSSPERLAIAGIPFSVYPAVKATREDYLNYLRGVVRAYDLKIQQQTRLTSAQKTESGFECHLTESDWSVGGPHFRELDEFTDRPSQTIHCRRIVLAIGDMHRARSIGIRGEESRHVTHYLPDIHSLFGKRVVIVGAKNSAAEAIVRLARFNQNMVLIHRGPDISADRVKPWLLPEIRSLIIDRRIDFYPNSIVSKIDGKQLEVRNHVTNETKDIEFDKLLLLTGYDQDPTLFQRLGLELVGDNQSPALDPHTMESSVPGIFVAGTAVAGSQRDGAKVFIENCHVHTARIVDALLGNKPAPLVNTDRDEIHREL